jgi:hypothetical protein
LVLLTALPEDFLPGVFRAAEHGSDEFASFIARRATRWRRSRRLFVLRTATAEDLRATNQQAWIDPERPTDETQYNNGADADSAATDGKATAAAKAPAIASVFDVVAAAKVIPAHCVFLVPTFRGYRVWINPI